MRGHLPRCMSWDIASGVFSEEETLPKVLQKGRTMGHETISLMIWPCEETSLDSDSLWAYHTLTQAQGLSTLCPTLRSDLMSLSIDCVLQANNHKHKCLLQRLYYTHILWLLARNEFCQEVTSHLISKLGRV